VPDKKTMPTKDRTLTRCHPRGSFHAKESRAREVTAGSFRLSSSRSLSFCFLSLSLSLLFNFTFSLDVHFFWLVLESEIRPATGLTVLNCKFRLWNPPQAAKRSPCHLPWVKLKFNEPWNSKPFHVATIAASRRTRSRTPRVFNYISFEHGIAEFPHIVPKFTPEKRCSLRVSDLRDIQDNLGAWLPSIEPQCREWSFTRFDFQKEQPDKQRTSASSTYNTFPDDLYLDDQDALEGSGRGGSDNRDDLEASGSGLGPDDEDGDDDHGTDPI